MVFNTTVNSGTHTRDICPIISLGLILRREHLSWRGAQLLRVLMPVPNYLLKKPRSSPKPSNVWAVPCEPRIAACVLNGVSLGLFKAKTSLRRLRIRRLSQTATRRRKNIAKTSGRASSSPSLTQPALGARPLSPARLPTSSYLVGSRGKSRCPSPGTGVSLSSALPSVNIQGMYLECLLLARLQHETQQSLCSVGLLFWWGDTQ